MKKILLLVFAMVLLCPFGPCYGQNDKTILRFLDAETNAALANVRILADGRSSVGVSDKEGYIVLPLGSFSKSTFLVAILDGYAVDTLNGISGQYYLSRLSVELTEATISGAQVRRLLDLPSEYVVDYCFIGDNMLTTTYSGNNGRKAKVLLLNSEGKELGRCSVPDEPTGMYTSCLGINYVVCAKRFYPISINGSKLSLKQPYPISLLRGLQQCEHSLNGNMYYRITDKHNFKVDYGMIARGDSNYKSFKVFEEREEARASYTELMEIIALLEHWQFHEAGRKAGLRAMWDKGSFAHINLPLQLCGDSLVVFDYFKKQILFFDSSGIPVGATPARFGWNHAQLFNILKDDATGKFYIHRHDSKASQTVQELDIKTGKEKGLKYKVMKQFTDKLKVHYGKIYYLWQDGKNAATQQLFVQPMN